MRAGRSAARIEAVVAGRAQCADAGGRDARSCDGGLQAAYAGWERKGGFQAIGKRKPTFSGHRSSGICPPLSVLALSGVYESQETWTADGKNGPGGAPFDRHTNCLIQWAKYGSSTHGMTNFVAAERKASMIKQ